MKVIYKLPQYLALIVCGCIAFVICRDIKLAKSTDIFDLMKYSNSVGNDEFTILGVDSYWFLMMVGLAFAIILALLRRKMLNINPAAAALIAVLFFFQAFLGAKILCGLENVINNMSFQAFDMDGQSLYGTVFISFIFIPVLARIMKRDTRLLFDYVAPFWLTLLVFVRLGCYTTGCCGADACSISGIELVLPVQLFEVVCDLIVLQLVFNNEKKRMDGNETNWNEGFAFFIMIAIYGMYRFVLEFIRSTSVIFLGMTYGQIYAIVCILIAIGYIYRQKKREI